MSIPNVKLGMGQYMVGVWGTEANALNEPCWTPRPVFFNTIEEAERFCEERIRTGETWAVYSVRVVKTASPCTTWSVW